MRTHDVNMEIFYGFVDRNAKTANSCKNLTSSVFSFILFSPFQFNKSKLFLAVFAAVLGNFNFGYSLVYPSPVLPVLQGPDADPRERMDTSQAALFGSIYMLGVACGGLGAMLLNDLIGRKLSIMVSAIPSATGSDMKLYLKGL